MMKQLIAGITLALAAGAALAVASVTPGGPPERQSAVVVQANGLLAVKVDGQLVYLTGVTVVDAAGRRSDVKLAAGTPVTFILGPENTSPRIREVQVAR